MRIARKHVKGVSDGVSAPNDGDLLQFDAATDMWITSPGSDTFEATFDNAVGAKTVEVRKHGLLVTLEIPTGTTADGGGGAIQSGATDVPAAYRPAANISFPAIVTSNAAKVSGKLVITSTGRIQFYASAADGNFTDNAVAGFDRIAVTYSL